VGGVVGRTALWSAHLQSIRVAGAPVWTHKPPSSPTNARGALRTTTHTKALDEAVGCVRARHTGGVEGGTKARALMRHEAARGCTRTGEM
jgi:hypothetical protein